MNGYLLMYDIFVNHFDAVNNAIANYGQVTLESDSGDSTIKISFFDNPIYLGSVSTYVCGLAIFSSMSDSETYTAFCKPSLSSGQCLFLKVHGSNYEFGDDSDYHMFSYAAVVWAHEHNWQFPKALPEYQLHRDIRQGS